MTNDQSQGPFEGSRCVAGPGGLWGLATIRKVCDDGTFKIEFDKKEMVIIPFWHGVTPSEVSFDDEGKWKDVFARISPDERSFSEADFTNALSLLGYKLSQDRAADAWNQAYKAVRGQAPCPDASLDEESSYRLFIQLHLSAKHCKTLLEPDGQKTLFKLYWNQLRMGGREPSELSREVTLQDAFNAIGLEADRIDRSTVDFLRQVEQEQEVRLPVALTRLLRCEGAANAVKDSHPNNPSFVDFDASQWTVRRGMREQKLDGDCALLIMIPHQGDHEWVAVFDDGEEDARVYVRWDDEDGESWLVTASTLAMFFWDLAQTGLIWFQDTRHDGGKPVRRTDIGLALGS